MSAWKKITGAAAVSVLTVMSIGVAQAGDAKAGQEKAALCGGCHGTDGISISPEIPNLRGQKETYILKAIGDFKSGARKNPMMSAMAAGLTDQDAADIAAYFSSLK